MAVADTSQIGSGKMKTSSDKPSALGMMIRSGAWLSLLSIVLYFVVWFAITRDGLALVRPIKFPSPLMVLQAAIRTADLIPADVFATLSRVIFGFFAGLILGVGLGLAMSYNKKVFYFFDSCANDRSTAVKVRCRRRRQAR